MSGPMQHPGHSPPHAIEYTLQGVMRFLQTEWHRHERDRNAWEIERLEMRGRIATLEGQVRRSDATQKALHRYVGILQNRIREQQQGGASGAGAKDADADKDERAARLKEALKGSKRSINDQDPELVDDDMQRTDIKTFLEQCATEFSYLSITPANPLPPRDSPPLTLEDFQGVEGLQLMGDQPQFPPGRFQQSHQVDIPARQHGVPSQGGQQQLMVRNAGPQHSQEAPPQSAPMGRAASESSLRSTLGTGPSEWGGARGEEPQPRHPPNTERPSSSDRARSGAQAHAKPENAGDDGWNLAFSHPDTAPAQAAANRSDTDVFPAAADNLPKSPGRVPSAHRRKGSMSRRRSSDQESSLAANSPHKAEGEHFRLRYGLRGHLNVVRAVIFSGGGSPGEPEVCTAGDDGTVKRFHIPRLDGHPTLGPLEHEVAANFTHRGHTGIVLSLASWSPSPNFSTGGRAQGDGWIFSGGADSSIRVWERGRVDPKATLEGHTDAVWALCVLPGTFGSVFGPESSLVPADRILLVSGSADGTVRLWAVSAPPQLTSPQPSTGSGRVAGARGRARGNSTSSGSAFPASPQPSMASSSPFHSTLIHTIPRPDGSKASPTAITPLGPSGETFVVSYSDAAVLVFDARSGEQVGSMDSLETYDKDKDTAVVSLAATTVGFEQAAQVSPGTEDENVEQRAGAGPTGGGRSMAGSGVEGIIISGHADQFIRFYDANSGQCTYSMVAHPDAVSSLSLSPDGRELVSSGQDASLRFWDLEKRSCTQAISSHRVLRGEGICAVVWSQDGRWVVSCGADGIVKVYSR